MMRARLRTLLALFFSTGLSLAALGPRPALAQEAEPAASPDKVAKAKELFEAGGRAYDRGQYTVALQAFQQAYDIVPRNGLLFSIAQSHRKLYGDTGDQRHREEALRLYRKYLDIVKTGGRRSAVLEAVAQLEASYASDPPKSTPSNPTTPQPTPVVEARKTGIYVTSAIPGLKISIDGGAPLDASQAIELKPGSYTARLLAEGYETYETKVEVQDGLLSPVAGDPKPLPGKITVQTDSGADVSVDGLVVATAPLSLPLSIPPGEHTISAQLLGHETRSAPIVVSRGADVDVPLDLPETRQRVAAQGVLGAAAGIAGVSIGLGVAAWVRQNAADAVLDASYSRLLTNADLKTYKSARADRDQLRAAAFVAGGVSGLAAIIGLGLFLVDPPARPEITPKSSTPDTQPTPNTPDDLAAPETVPSAPSSVSFLPGVVDGPYDAVGLTLDLRF
ncbi:MAG: PEGA domain-containing protein [Polyangiaceae bacterium]